MGAKAGLPPGPAFVYLLIFFNRLTELQKGRILCMLHTTETYGWLEGQFSMVNPYDLGSIADAENDASLREDARIRRIVRQELSKMSVVTHILLWIEREAIRVAHSTDPDDWHDALYDIAGTARKALGG